MQIEDDLTNEKASLRKSIETAEASAVLISDLHQAWPPSVTNHRGLLLKRTEPLGAVSIRQFELLLHSNMSPMTSF